MNKCEYCNKEVERPVFCSNTHRVYYHRGLKVKAVVAPKIEVAPVSTPVSNPEPFEEPELRIIKEKEDIIEFAPQILKAIEKPVFHCKKHYGSLSINCGCNE